MGNDSVLEEGKELERLTADFLSAPDLKSPDLDLVGRLYVANFQRLVVLFQIRLTDRRVAEDAVQEAFIALQDHYAKNGALPDHPASFLFVAARNWLMKRTRHDGKVRISSLEEQPSASIDELIDPGSHARKPFEAVASTELKGVAQEAMETLDDTTRKIVELHRQGKSWDDVAKEAGVPSGERARKLFDHAVHHVKAALGAHFSSCITTAEAEIRRSINRPLSAIQAIDLLPPPYDEILALLLVEKKGEEEVAKIRKTTPDSVRRDRERALELFQRKFKMSEAELRAVLGRGR